MNCIIIHTYMFFLLLITNVMVLKKIHKGNACKMIVAIITAIPHFIPVYNIHTMIM